MPNFNPNAFAASLLENLLSLTGQTLKGAGSAVMNDPKLGPALTPAGAMQTVGGAPGMGASAGMNLLQQNPNMAAPGPMGAGMALGQQLGMAMSPSKQLIATTAQKATEKAIGKSIEQRVMSGANPEQILQAYGYDQSAMMMGMPNGNPLQTAGQAGGKGPQPGDPNLVKTDQKTGFATPQQQSLNPGASGLSPSASPKQPNSSQSAPGAQTEDPLQQEKVFGNPMNFLQTLLTIATGGIIPTPGYIESSQRVQTNRLKKAQQIENAGYQSKVGMDTQELVKRADQVPLTQAEKASRQTSLDVAGMNNQTELLKKQAELDRQGYKDTVAQENVISAQYDKEMEPLVKAKASYEAIKSYVENPEAGGGYTDWGIAYELIKMYDPNAVREGELANIKHVKSVPEWLLNGYNQALSGRMLNDGQRKKILNTATTKVNALQKTYAPLADKRAQQVKAYGGDPDRALINHFQTKIQELSQSVPGLKVRIKNAKS